MIPSGLRLAEPVGSGGAGVVDGETSAVEAGEAATGLGDGIPDGLALGTADADGEADGDGLGDAVGAAGAGALVVGIGWTDTQRPSQAIRTPA